MVPCSKKRSVTIYLDTFLMTLSLPTMPKAVPICYNIHPVSKEQILIDVNYLGRKVSVIVHTYFFDRELASGG